MTYYWVPRGNDHGDQGELPQPAPKFMYQEYAGGGADAEWTDGYVPEYTYPRFPRAYDDPRLEGHGLQARPMASMQYWGNSKWGRFGNAGGDTDYEQTLVRAAYAANSLMGFPNEKGSNDSPADSSDEVPMTQEAIEKRGQILVIELELSAWMALEDVAETEADSAVKESVALAQRYLKCPSQSTLSAALALHEISNAVAEIGPSPTQEKLVEVEKAVRDVVVCRCQLATIFGVRHLFVKELQKVFDYPKLDSNARSKLMHSHRTIFGDWPGVFKSHCTAHARLRSMRKSEKQQQRRAAAEGYEAGACRAE